MKKFIFFLCFYFCSFNFLINNNFYKKDFVFKKNIAILSRSEDIQFLSHNPIFIENFVYYIFWEKQKVPSNEIEQKIEIGIEFVLSLGRRILDPVSR